MIFVSHSGDDDGAVDRIVAALAEFGFTCWVDHQHGIVPGDPSWDGAIRSAIEACDYGVFVMSPKSLAANICAAECLLVRELRKPLYVLRLEHCHPADVWLYIKLIQYADLVRDFERGIKSLVSALQGKTTKGLAQPIRQQITGADTMRHYLPYLNNPLRGRGEDVERIQAGLGKHIFQIVGTGGLGKSRLAAEVALSHLGGAVWHRCSRDSNANDALQLFRQHLQLPDDAAREVVLARLSLEKPPPLLVIDNADIVREKAKRQSYIKLLEQLLDRRVPVVLTTRSVWNELKPRHEHTLSPLSLDISAKIALDFATSDNIPLTNEQAIVVAEKARLHPWLIGFAIGQLHEREFERVIKQLSELQHESLKKALDKLIRKTVRQMTEQIANGKDAKRLLKRLTIIQGLFTFDAASALSPDELKEEVNLEEALVTLQRWQFIRRSGGRYSLAELVREAVGIPVKSEIFNAYANFYITRAGNIFTLPPDKWREHEADFVDITAVGDALQTRSTNGTVGDVDRAMNFAFNTKNYVYRRQEAQKQSWLHMGLNAVRKLRATQKTDKALISKEGNFLNDIGTALHVSGEKRDAIEAYEQALVLFRTIGDKTDEAATLNNLGKIWDDLGDPQKALALYEAALPLHQATDEPVGKVTNLNNIGTAWGRLKEFDKALDFFNQAMLLSRQYNDFTNEAAALNNIGMIWDWSGDLHKALDYYEQTLPLWEKVGLVHGEAVAINNIGSIWSMLGDQEKALNYLEQALRLYRSAGIPAGEAMVYFNVGYIRHSRGETDQPITFLENAVQIMTALEDPSLEYVRGVLEKFKQERDSKSS